MENEELEMLKAALLLRGFKYPQGVKSTTMMCTDYVPRISPVPRRYPDARIYVTWGSDNPGAFPTTLVALYSYSHIMQDRTWVASSTFDALHLVDYTAPKLVQDAYDRYIELLDKRAEQREKEIATENPDP